MLISSYLDDDFADGQIDRIIEVSTQPDGVFGAVVITADGEKWFYPEQHYALNYGEIARQLEV